MRHNKEDMTSFARNMKSTLVSNLLSVMYRWQYYQHIKLKKKKKLKNKKNLKNY